ncbi:MAG TPA: putative glycoside hydrolase [Gemmatimonadaceae bacterium]|jgi:hypothetical protein
MTPRFRILLPAIGVLCACGEHAATLSSKNIAGQALTVADQRRDSAVVDSARRAAIVHVRTPPVLRGLYVNRWAALGKKIWQLIDVAETTEVNALVIDVKDDRGFVLYKSRVPLAREIGADTTMPMSQKRLRSILDTMAALNIYPIARIVVAKDPLLAGKRLDLAIKRRDNLEPWLDKNGKPWLDPNHREIWQYAADLAKEAYDLGFSEVQFDYVRFPDEKRLVNEAVYPLAKGRVRAQVIREQLGFLRNTLAAAGIPMTIDVFGLTATDTTDMGIGQRWEMFVDRADVVLPMVYPSHFAPGTYKLGNPNAHPYSTIDHALKDVKRRSAAVAGAAKVIPWYQDFTLGPPHYYADHVRAQKKAGYDNGFQSWILWNPGSRYTVSALDRDSSSADGTK